MKKYAVIVALLGLFVGPAQASITTYTWHQTWASVPGLKFAGLLSEISNSPLIDVSSFDPQPDFSDVVDFHVEGGGLALALADFKPCATEFCDDGSWVFSDFRGTPFIALTDFPSRLDWQVAEDTISLGTGPGSMCPTLGDCWAMGFWSAVPEPANLPVALGGLLALVGLVGTGRKRAQF